MGSAVTAVCKCGYEKDFMIGGGMMDFMEVCHFPCLCKKCEAVVDVNIMVSPPICSVCKDSGVVPYDNEELILELGEEEVASWNMEEKLGREVKLTDGKYYCPNCKEFHLTFLDGGLCWD